MLPAESKSLQQKGTDPTKNAYHQNKDSFTFYGIINRGHINNRLKKIEPKTRPERKCIRLTHESKLIISPLTDDLIEDINKTNDPFRIYGRVVPRLQSGKWSYEEVLFDEETETRFPDDHLEWDQYIDREDKKVFLAYLNDSCIGQIRVVKEWNRFCYIENIATKREYRGSGVGKALLHQAEEWARERSLIGMSLEAQDDNLDACRFYVKQGFKLGGVDTLKQAYNPNIDATLYWYKLF